MSNPGRPNRLSDPNVLHVLRRISERWVQLCLRRTMERWLQQYVRQRIMERWLHIVEIMFWDMVYSICLPGSLLLHDADLCQKVNDHLVLKFQERCRCGYDIYYKAEHDHNGPWDWSDRPWDWSDRPWELEDRPWLPDIEVTEEDERWARAKVEREDAERQNREGEEPKREEQKGEEPKGEEPKGEEQKGEEPE
ncbi:hypothetical protein QBC37DRAFT_397406 [Rhypophila decipiens]|uniref:Uncharacterized protein n=1 Tax=Rhypophila decipiens TaxID=261697 RepID=A0AAN7BAK0_9PEZI|nr:hypothetical protein QBC37DRAFT_397406 [Rhypophila decipiens]